MRQPQHHMLFLWLYLCLSASSSFVFALPDDAEQDLLLESESLEYNEGKGTITYSGSVVMQQGSMLIKANRVVIHGNINQATKVTANGEPAHFEQTPEIDAIPVTAQANRLEYKVSDKSLLLQGDASLHQEGTSLSGNLIEYDVKNSVVRAKSNDQHSNEKQRVRMIIPPKVLEPNAN